jgi:hypothetical protein
MALSPTGPYSACGIFNTARIQPFILLWLVLVPVSTWAQGFSHSPFQPEQDLQVTSASPFDEPSGRRKGQL